MQLKIDFKGQREIEKALKKLQKDFPRAALAALYQEGAEILTAAIKRTPKDFGVLRSSGYVAPPTGEAQPVVEVGFGTEYAIPVHEVMGARHTVGEAKFLERALDERSSGMLARLAEWTIDNEKRGVGLGSLPGVPTKPSPNTGLRKPKAKKPKQAAKTKKAAKPRAQRKP